jgi:glutathione S-transferase
MEAVFMKLLYSPTSPYARKARIIIREKNLKVTEEPVIPWDNPPELVNQNPLCKIPTLITDDGTSLYDSRVIVEYVDSLGAPALIPETGELRWAVRRWEAMADGIMDAGVVRYREIIRSEGDRSTQLMERQEAAIDRALAYTNEAVNGEFLVGGKLSVADIAMASALGYTDLRFRTDWREQYPALADWHAALNGRPSFAETAPPKA